MTRKKLTTGLIQKSLRRLAATLCFMAVTLFFVSGSTSLMLRLKWITTVQIVPVALSVSVPLILLWVVATMVFGRIYCSTVCPMGYLQDVFARLPRLSRRARQKRCYRYLAPKNRLRLSWLVLVIVSLLAGTSLLISLFDPYAAYGRIAAYIVAPVVEVAGGRELLAGTAVGVAVAAVTLAVIAVVSALSGRTFCNTLCPVGSTLGLLSANSLYRFDIDTDRCVQCRRCEHACKSRCISMADHVVDMSRCVVCFDCVSECDSGAIRYTFSRHRLSTPLMMRIGFGRPQTTLSATAGSDSASKPRQIDRRTFMMTGVILAAAPAVMAVDRVLKAADDGARQTPAHRPVTPPGIGSTGRFLSSCVGCGACIKACPSEVLRPSTNGYGWHRSLHPVMDYDESFCDFDCNVCTQVCPTSALRPLSVEEKQSTAIGLATVDADHCIGCGKCARLCPKQTIRMEPTASGRRVAVVDRSGCIGCGRCQYVCPAQPVRAVVVNGLQR